LESSGRNNGKEKGTNSRKGKQKELVDRRRPLAGKVEESYSSKEQLMFTGVKQSV